MMLKKAKDDAFKQMAEDFNQLQIEFEREKAKKTPQPTAHAPLKYPSYPVTQNAPSTSAIELEQMRATEAERNEKNQADVTAQLQRDISSQLAAAMSLQMQSDKEQFEENLRAKYATDYDAHIHQVRSEALKHASKEAAATMKAAEEEASRMNAAQQQSYSEVMNLGENESARRVLEENEEIRILQEEAKDYKDKEDLKQRTLQMNAEHLQRTLESAKTEIDAVRVRAESAERERSRTMKEKEHVQERDTKVIDNLKQELLSTRSIADTRYAQMQAQQGLTADELSRQAQTMMKAKEDLLVRETTIASRKEQGRQALK